MNANRCYRYTFCLAKWKEKWAQKMQNHSLTEISSKISSQLGISFQRSIQYLPLLCLEELSLDPNREKKQYIELREHFFCFFLCFFRCTIPSHPLYMSFLNLTAGPFSCLKFLLLQAGPRQVGLWEACGNRAAIPYGWQLGLLLYWQDDVWRSDICPYFLSKILFWNILLRKEKHLLCSWK